MSRKKAAVEAIKAKKAQERAEARAEAEAKAQAAKGKTTSRASKASKSSNASKSKLPPPALSEAPTSTGFVAAKRLEDATPEELERLRLTPDGRMFRGEMLSSKPRALNVESNAESAQKAEIAEKAGTEATPATAPLDPADWTARPHTSFKTRLYDQYARNSAARATLLDRFAEMERERKEREEREAKEKDDEQEARKTSTDTEHDEPDKHQPPQPSDTEDAMTKTNRTASETVEADEDDEPLEQHDPRLEEKDGEVDLDDFDYNPEGLARMISDGYSDEEDDEEDDYASEDEGEGEDEEDEEEDVVRASVDASAAASATPASPASPAVSALSESKEEAKPAAKTPAKTAGKTESAEASVSSGNSGKNPAKVDAEAQKKPAEKAPAKTPANAPKTQAAAPKKTPAKAQAPKAATKNTPKNGTKNGTKTAAKPQANAQGMKATQQPKTRAKQQPQQPKPAASAPKTSAPAAPKASTPEAKAPAIDPATPVVMKAEVPANVVEPVVDPVLEPVTEEGMPAYVAAQEVAEAPAVAQAAEPEASAKPEKPAKKVRDKTGRRAHGYADALRHAADVKAAAEARVEVSLGRTLDEINGASEEDDDEDDNEEAEIETMTPALRFSTANATLEADEPAPILASQGTKGSKASRDGMLPEVERIDGRRATLPRNRTGKALPRITPLYADDPAPVDVGRAYLYAVDERARALMDEDADRLMEEGFRDRYVVRTDRDGPSPVENCLRLEAETPAILDAEAAARRARLEKEDARLEATDRTAERADGTIEGDAREPRKTVRFGRFPFALLPGKRARDAETKNAKSAKSATIEKSEADEAREVPEVCEPVDVEEARTTSARDAVAEATEGKKAAGTVPAAKARGASVERPADAAPAAHGARKGESSNASAASTASKSSKGSSSEAASKTSFSRPTKTTVVLGLTALVASGLAIALAFTHPAVEAGVKKTAEVLKSWVPAALTGEAASDTLHPAILVVDRGAVEERAALARLAATRPGAQASHENQEPNAFASIDREAIDRAIEATAAEHRAIVLDRRLVLAAAPEFALEFALSSDVASKTSEPSATSAASGNSATAACLTGLDATPEVLRRLGLDQTDPAALERAVMEHWFPKAKEARGTENAMKAGTSSESAESAESAGVAVSGAPVAPAKTLRDLAALLLPEGTEHGASDAAAGFLPVK